MFLNSFFFYAAVVKLADAMDSKSIGLILRAGSTPALGTIQCGCSSMVELQPSKLTTRVRFPSPAPFEYFGLI